MKNKKLVYIVALLWFLLFFSLGAVEIAHVTRSYALFMKLLCLSIIYIYGMIGICEYWES